MKTKSVNIRELCFLSLLVAILFVQETIMSYIPNVQLSVLLIMVYASTLGLSKATFVMTVHVLLDNMLWGSMSPTTVLPMWLGWFIVTLIGWALRRARLPFIVVGSVIGSLCYCWSFVLFKWLFLPIDIMAYVVSDILFEILICCSSVVTVTILYRPTERLLKKFYQRVCNERQTEPSETTQKVDGETEDE